MEELDIAAVTKRSIHGVFALVTRTFFISIVSFVVNVLLTIVLLPSTYGVYGVVLAVIAFLQYFSDIGLAGALIQKKEQLTQDDLKTTFTLQQILVITVSCTALLLSSTVGNFYHLNAAGILLFQALVVSFFLSSLKTIPSIVLERNLYFDKLVIPQIVETLVFSIVVLVMALKGFGISSFTVAVLARGVAGLITIYIISPWKIGFGISKPVAKRLLSFGIPFQANSFLALLKDDLMIAYIGKVLPFSQVGYIIFAQKWAFTPLRLIMDNVIRITFPSFSRLQHEKDHLATAIEKSLFAACLLIFPSIVGLVILAPSFVQVIPKYQKWEPALISLAFFAVNAAFSSVSTPLTNALNAIGKIKVSLYLMIFWTIATWVLTPLALYLYGYNAFAAISALISGSVVYVVFLAQKHISFSIKVIFPPTIASLIMGVVLLAVTHIMPTNLFSIGMSILLGGAVYLFCMYLLAQEMVKKDILIVKQHLFS